MKKNFIVFFVIAVFPLIGQNFSSHQIALTPTAFPEYKFNEDEYLEQLQARFKDEPDKDLVKEYAKFSLADKKYFFNSNDIYTNWPEATEFVKNVFLKTVPENFTTSDIKIYVIRSPDFNAFCMEDGNILVTTGFLAFMNNEAELASTLSHEYGHYYCNHNFYSYKAKKKSDRQTKGSGYIRSLSAMDNYYHHLKEAERVADTFSFNFVKKNGYSPEGIISDFESANKISEKYKSLRGYRKPLIYFSTHPSNKERINKARDFQQKNKIGGKAFLVDSVQFLKIKKRAIDECIYLLFEEFRFDECLEMAFLQHLFYQDDDFYLYFIVECLQGKMATADQFYGRYPFITAYYDPAKLSHNKFQPYCKNIKWGTYEKHKEYKTSVFNNLQSSIYHLSDEQVAQIRHGDIIKKDTIPFFTNNEALSYFKNKIEKRGPAFNIQKLKFDLPVDSGCSVTPEKSELENDLCEIYNNFKNYNAKWDSLENGMVVLHRVRFYDYDGAKLHLYNDIEKQKKFVSQFHEFADSNTFMYIINEDVLNFRERSKIKYIANFVESINDERFLGKSVDVDFLKACPEFVLQAMKNNVETIFIVNLYLYSVDYSQAYIYGVDIRNKRISITKVPLESSYKTPPEKIFRKVFSECESMIKN